NNTKIGIQQSGIITGKVVSSSAVTLPGATVEIVELKRSMMTDAQGQFSLVVPPGVYTLKITFIGHEGFEQSAVTVTNGQTTVINAMLIEQINSMDEVVVTALGITREEKEIGY